MPTLEEVTAKSRLSTLTLADITTLNWKGLLSDPAVQFVSFDIETNGVDPFKDPEHFEARGYSLSVKKGDQYLSDYFPVSHTRGRGNLSKDEWKPILELAMGKTVIIHHYLADAKFVEWFGVKFADTFYDTLKLCHLDNENYAEGDGYSLEACCKRYLGRPGKSKSADFEMMLQLVGWEGLAYENVCEYAAYDAESALRLFYCLQKKIGKTEPKLVNYWKRIEAPNLQALKSMRELGVKVDLDFCSYMEDFGMQAMANIEDEMGMKFSGPGSVKNIQKLFWEDLKLPIMYNKRKRKDGTVEETPSLDKKVMERYELMLEAREDPTASKILTYRGWQKAVTAFYRPYQKFCDADGRLRTNYKSHGTVTGRYSSSEPNLQQIPKECDKPWNGTVKRAFIPEDGYELWEFDYSQLEFRLAALFSGEPKLLDVFNDDSRDIFSEMSTELGLIRQQCKTLTYSIQYGAGAQRIMDVFGYTRSQATQTIDSWYAAYPAIRTISSKTEIEVRKFGKIELWSGRYRHFKYPRSDARKAFNSAIQGGAADIVKLAMNNIRRELPELRMLLQIHDALVFEIPTGLVETYKPQIIYLMEHPIDQDRVHLKLDGHRMAA